MSEVKHTPGPWHDDNDGVFYPGGVVCNKPKHVDNARNWPANARLIAAAPDMLAELQRLYRMHGYRGTADLIAKATGLDPGTASVAHVDETGGSQESKP